MARLVLSELLPLRTTRQLGDYAEATPLPEVLGDLRGARFPLIRLSPTRYLAADHPMTVADVYVADQVAYDWDQVTESDGAGHTWTIVRMAAAIPFDTAVSGTGTGRLNPATGDLISNPGDVLARISAIAGRDDDWTQLRAECSRYALTVAGRIAGGASVRATIDAVAQSVGAIWTPGMARLYPSAADPSPIIDLHPSEVDIESVSASVSDTADVLRLSYDTSDASGKPLHFIELSASPQLYGGVVKETTHGWLRTPQCAETVGRPMLQRLAGERYDVSMTTSRRSVRPGMWIRPVAHPAWPLPGDDPVIMVMSVSVEPHGAVVAVTGEYLSTKPNITVTAHSLALPDAVQSGLAVAYSNGVATFTLTDDSGSPIAGALIALDGSAPKTTDAQGRAFFDATPGVHNVAFEAAGYVPVSMQVEL